MPTYEYLCRQCGHRFEAWQHMTDEPLKVCPKCGAEIHRVLYPAGIVFKGSGFYKTEYGGGSSSGEKGNSTEGKAEGKAASSESKSSTESSKGESSSSKSDSAGSGASPASTAAD